MAISLRAVGVTTTAAGAVTGVTAGVPAGLIATDLSILTVEAKQATAGTAVTISTPSGWTLIGSVTNNGTNLTAGTDTGTNYVAMFYRVGTYTAPTITTTGATSMGAAIVAYQTSWSGTWDVSSSTTGSDTTSGANGSITGAANLSFAAGDWAIVGAGLSGDLGSVTAETLAATGATIGTRVNRVNLGVTTGFDSRLLVSDWPVTAGTSSAAPAYTWTNTSSLTGHARVLRLREVAPTPGAKVATLTADFSTTDPAFTYSPEASVSGGQLSITTTTGYPRVTSNAFYDFTNSAAFVEFVSPATSPSEDVFMLRSAAAYGVRFAKTGTALQLIKEDESGSTFPSVTYDPLAHRWLRLRHDGTNVYWETSPDASTWTAQRTETLASVPMLMTNMQVWLMSGSATPGGGASVWDNLNAAGAILLLTDNARAETRASRPLLSQASPLTVRAARSATRASRPLLTQQQPTLTVRAARSATRAGRPLLTQQQGILVRAARSVARTSRPQLTQQQATLTITGSRATTRTSRALLTQATSLTVAAARAHTRTGPALLAQDTPLTIRGARAAATASHPVLSQHSPLTVRPARAATRAQDARLAAAGQVAVYDTRTQTRASRPRLTQDTPLTVHGARTATRTATATLTSAAPTLTIRGARSQTRAAVAALEQLQLLTVAGARAPARALRVTLTGTAATGSAARTYTVPADNRTTSIAPDNRTVSVPPDPRTVHVAAEDRTHTVPAATRILASA